MTAPSVKIFYCDIQNAGDQFNLDIFRHYGFAPEYSDIHLAEVVSTGSILGWIQSNYLGAVMGPGFMFGETTHPLNRSAVYAVRGKLSKARIFRKNVVLGDPGLLAGQIYKQAKVRPQFALGVIPHFYDYECPAIQRLVSSDPKNILLIDIRQKTSEVACQIATCAAIASSSLHGLVFADAFNVPSVWMNLSEKVQGAGFKFFDYYSTFDEKPIMLDVSQLDSISRIIGKTKCRRGAVLDEVKQSLDSLYCRLDEIIDEVRKRKNSPLHQTAKIIRNRCSIYESGKYTFLKKEARQGIPPILKWLP